MSIFEIFLTAIALSMDAFAVAICTGLSGRAQGLKRMVVVGLYFGAAQGIMPILGFFLASGFSEHVVSFGNIIAFALLVFLGVKMILDALSGKEESCPSIAPSKMLPFAIATSIDAAVVGVSFAFLPVNILSAALIIGVTTFLLSVIGVKVGCVFGLRFKKAAEIFGGVVLVIIGINAL